MIASLSHSAAETVGDRYPIGRPVIEAWKARRLLHP
jgi:hypothetical protein